MSKKKHIKRAYRQHALWTAADRSRLTRFFSEFASLVFIDYAVRQKHDVEVLNNVLLQGGAFVTPQDIRQYNEYRKLLGGGSEC